MGFEDRDYYRDEDQPGGLFGGVGIGNVCKYLIAANIAVFLLQVLTTRDGGSAVTNALNLDLNAVLAGEVWRLVTWGFGYDGNPLGFIFEMLFLWWFGKAIEDMVGSREMLFLYFASMAVAVFATVAAALATGVAFPFMGAAIPVMAITTLFAWHFPTHQILLFFLIPVPIWILVVIYVVMSLVSYAGTGFGGGPFVSGLAAVAFGLAYGKFGWRVGNLVPTGTPRLRMPRRRPKLRVYEPEKPADLDRQVDAILAKIHEQGEASLTDRERKTLEEASRRYRKT